MTGTDTSTTRSPEPHHRLQGAAGTVETRAMAKRFGPDVVVNNSREDALAVVMELTGGVDVAIEAVGTPATFQLATTLIRPWGHIANIGVHAKPATLHLEQLWDRDVTITTGAHKVVITA